MDEDKLQNLSSNTREDLQPFIDAAAKIAQELKPAMDEFFRAIEIEFREMNDLINSLFPPTEKPVVQFPVDRRKGKPAKMNYNTKEFAGRK